MAVDGAATAPDDLIELGRIISAYGVRGWVKIQPHSAQGTVLRAAPVWWLAAPVAPLAKPSALVPHKVKQVRPQGSTLVADLEGVGERDLAESMRGHTVFVSRQHFPKANSDEFYWVDLVDCQVFGEGVLLGVVHEVVDNGAHALLKVHRLQTQEAGEPLALLDAKGKPQEMLVPFVAAHVQHVDIAARRIDTDWPIDF
ncbi:MAG: ribosome maturation factor RimM [Alcaligenaceae bacterium]